MLDFSEAEDQREFVAGPVPSGSVVMVEMEVLQPADSRKAHDNPYISVAQSGLRQIYCQFTVTHGSYRGVSFRQNITLPLAAQQQTLNQKQITACHIGASQLKAICLAARKPTKIKDVTSLTGLRFPVKVKINPRPSESKDGRVFWNNEISLIITPDKENYGAVYNGGEIITNGAVTGDETAVAVRHSQPQQQGGIWGNAAPSESQQDDDLVPF